GYATSCSLSDEELAMNGEEERDSMYSRSSEGKEEEEEGIHPGICPHCKFIFEKPVTLQCGHSLCDHCCSHLLSLMENTSIPRSRPRMGISSRSSIYKVLLMGEIQDGGGGRFTLWKSPRCVVCGEAPKKTPPVPNLSLQEFLITIRGKLGKTSLGHLLYENENKTHSLSHSSHGLSLPPESCRVSIRDCLISIIGSRGVGKTQFLQTQYCNDMLIDELVGRGKDGIRDSPFPHSPLSDISSLKNEDSQRRGVTYMLKLMEMAEVGERMYHSMGVVVAYSVVDRDSFHEAHRTLSLITNERGSEIPMILVGTKSDLEKRRQVQRYEGEMIATKQFNCPFIEVSSRRNECVNEAFVELVRVMVSRNMLK
ncbi:hypothetical protein PENTCL1PPCAC_124, partial [Pristionchus entomophagus]